jgi:hypothetical protein
MGYAALTTSVRLTSAVKENAMTCDELLHLITEGEGR